MTVITLASTSSKAVFSNVNVNDVCYDNIVPTFEYSSREIDPKAVMIGIIAVFAATAIAFACKYMGIL